MSELICRVIDGAAEDDGPETNSSGVAITAVTTLKHAILWEAAKKYGSQSALAKKLKVEDATLSAWVTLKRCPPSEPTGSWSARRIAALNKRFLRLFKMTIEDVFPPELRQNIAFLRAPKTSERTAIVHGEALAAHALVTRERLLSHNAAPIARLEQQEQTDDLMRVMRLVLKDRERYILQRRFGLDEEGQPTVAPETLVEVGAALGITKDRVRQIEWKAMQKIRQATDPASLRLRSVWA